MRTGCQYVATPITVKT